MKSVNFNLKISTVFLILFFAFIIRLPFLNEPLDADTGLFAAIGRSMHEGIVLYKDAIDNKPPGVFLLFFLLFTIFEPGPFVVNMFIVSWQILTVFLFYCLIKEIFNKRVVYIVTLIFAAFSSSPFIYGVSAETENFMVTFIITGFYFFLKSLKKQNNLFLMFLAGFSLGIGFIFKATSVAELSAVIVFLSLIYVWPCVSKATLNCEPKARQSPTERLPRRFVPRNDSLIMQGCIAARENSPAFSFLPRCLVLLFGFLTPFLISLIYFSSRDLFKEFIFAIFIYNLKYAQVLGYGSGNYWDKFLYFGFKIFQRFSLFWITGLIFIVGTALNLMKNKKDSKALSFNDEICLFISLWAMFSFLGVCSSGMFFPYYYITLVPSLSMMGGYVILSFLDKAKFDWRNYKNILLVLFMACSLAYTLLLHYKFYFVYTPEEISRKKYPWPCVAFVEAREAGEYIKDRINPDEYIYVWAEEPEIYFYAGKKSIEPYWKNTPFTYFSSIFPNAGDKIAGALEARKPQYIVIDTRHIKVLRKYKKIADFIQRNYFCKKEFKVIHTGSCGYSLLVYKQISK